MCQLADFTTAESPAVHKVKGAVEVDFFRVLFKLLKEQSFSFFQQFKDPPPQHDQNSWAWGPYPHRPVAVIKTIIMICMHLVKISMHISQQFI